LRSDLHYQWNWSIIGTYLFRYDNDAGKWVPGLLMLGLFTTIRLSIWSMILATFMGVAAGLCRSGNNLFGRLVGGAYVELFRNIPPLVLVFIFYFFLSDQLIRLLKIDEFVRSSSDAFKTLLEILFAPPAQVSAFFSAVITLGAYEGAYIAEIVRAGIQSIEKGQWESALSLGFSWWQQMRLVILPQAIGRVVPPLTGQFISTIKDSAIVSVISVQELTFEGMELMASVQRTFEIWITIALMYFLLTSGLSVIAGKLENRMRRPYSKM
jgi:polar amino acid transport system permease protein